MTRASEAIAAAYKLFEEAFFRGDADEMSRMYTEDAEWLIPEAPTVKGREAIARAWKSIVGSGGNMLRIDSGEVQEGGDWAFEVGTFTASAPDETILNAGKYIVIWQRQSTGDWKTYRDIFNWDTPPAPPAAS